MRRGPIRDAGASAKPRANLPGCYPDDEGENDRSPITSNTNPTAQPGTDCQIEFWLIQHIGDAVMALFGAPRAHDDDPYARRPRRLDVLGFFLKRNVREHCPNDHATRGQTDV